MGACIAAGIALSPPSTTGASASCRPRPSCAMSSAWQPWAHAISRSAPPTSFTGWRHSVAIVRALHERRPELTFDCTTKVEHVLEHAGVWQEIAASGCLFVVCALESVNDEILARLDKGHTTAEAVHALELLREHGIETRPSFMPFTPWTTRATARDRDSSPRRSGGERRPGAVHDPAARREGSLLLEGNDLREHLGPYDAERLSYPWRSATRSRPAPGPPQCASPAERRRAGSNWPDVRAYPRGGA